MAAVASPMTARQFDDQHIQWRELEGFKHMLVSIFFVDEVRNRVDLLIKFDPNEKVVAASASRRYQYLCRRGGACDL